MSTTLDEFTRERRKFLRIHHIAKETLDEESSAFKELQSDRKKHPRNYFF